MKDILTDCRRSLAATGVDGLTALRGEQMLVTGASGFAGSWLLATIAVLNDDHGFGIEVVALARRAGRDPSMAAFLAARTDIRPLLADVRQFVELPTGTAWIVHAAGNPDSRFHATDPIGTAATIGDGTFNLCRLAVPAESLRQILYFSSGLVGAGEGGRIGAGAVYTEAKRYGEALCAAFRSQARLPIVVTRPFTFIGPFQSLDAPWAVNNLLHAALHAQPLKLLGNGETARSFLYGSDMAVLALHQLVGGRTGETFDLGGTQPLSLIELAQLIIAEARRPLEIRINTGGREVATAPLVPDMRPSIERFGFTPAFSPADAVKRTLAWYADARVRIGA